MFRRGFRRGAIRRAMQPDVPPLLRRAHELMMIGNYPAAAEAFEQLGRAGESRQHPRTGQMYLQAGRARLLAGQKDVGFAHIKRGLGLLAAYPVQLQRAGNRVVHELNEYGMSAEAQEVAKWLKANLPPTLIAVEEIQNETRVASAKRPILPAKCPACGGVLRADEVEWIDEVTAECDWCGSPVRVDGS